MTEQSNNVEMVRINAIQTAGTQTRASLRQQAIQEYAASIDAGVEMDPCVIFREGQTLHLAAGFHRLEAYKSLGRTEVPCLVKDGNDWDAIQFGIKDNLRHCGERLSTADKVHAISLVLRSKPDLSNSAIAEMCGASDKTVAKYRRELEATSEIPKSDVRAGRDGRSIRTTAIGSPVGQDWTPRRWSGMSVEDRIRRCIYWWDGFSSTVLLLHEVGWNAQKITDFFGMRLNEDVMPILDPRLPDRELCEFEAISSHATALMNSYNSVAKHVVYGTLSSAYGSAARQAESEGLDGIAERLVEKEAAHAKLAESLQSTVWPGPSAPGIFKKSIAVDCCARTDARIAVGIEMADDVLEVAQGPLVDLFRLCMDHAPDYTTEAKNFSNQQGPQPFPIWLLEICRRLALSSHPLHDAGPGASDSIPGTMLAAGQPAQTE